MILDFLFPNRCLHCNWIIEAQSLLCEECLCQIPFTHALMDNNNELYRRCLPLFPLENAYPLMRFEQDGLSQKIIHQLKYSDREYFGQPLAQWVCERLTMVEKPDLIVTIPLHAKKEKKRGYNQLHLFANLLSQHYNIPIDHQLLKRNIHNQAQASKDKNHRTEVGQLFSITKEIQHQHILLVDDVFTTGNTMAAATWPILQMKGNRVSVLVMALD